MADVSLWSSALPSGSSSIRLGDDDIRSHKSMIASTFSEEHYFEDSSASGGIHKLGSARPFVGAASSASTTPDDGRLLVDPTNGHLYSLTTASVHTHPALGTENTWLSQQVFSSGISASQVTVGGARALTTADEGPGNGLDADTLDGFDSGVFPQAADTETIDGDWTFTSGISSSAVTIAGARALSTADEGSGNGIDADTVDGEHAAEFAHLAENETVTGNWTFDGATITTFDGAIDVNDNVDISGSLIVGGGTEIAKITKATGFIPAQTIAAATSASTSITVTGVAVGDVAIAVGTDDAQNDQINVTVSSVVANTVGIDVQNLDQSVDVVFESDYTINVLAFAMV